MNRILLFFDSHFRLMEERIERRMGVMKRDTDEMKRGMNEEFNKLKKTAEEIHKFNFFSII